MMSVVFAMHEMSLALPIQVADNVEKHALAVGIIICGFARVHMG